MLPARSRAPGLCLLEVLEGAHEAQCVAQQVAVTHLLDDVVADAHISTIITPEI